jgi:hypothetical protein
MGRTTPTITDLLHKELAALGRFRRALMRENQLALDEILVHVHHHMMAASYADHLLPFESFLLAMLLEEHKEILRLRGRVEELEGKEGGKRSALPMNPLGI